ncbi:MAG: acyl-CoA thioesterase II, partial [Halioglobus sp.]|nr:acyl-CoA thioesterase II [Halioglobus sp.]
LAQSLNSAIRTVEGERHAHSQHAYFLRPGNPLKQIVYEVDPIRDGKSFTTRRVVAKQDGVPIFNTTISFQIHEEGLEHQFDPVNATPPEEVETDYDFWHRWAKENPESKYTPPKSHPIERRSVHRRDPKKPQASEPHQQAWFRARGDLGDDPCKHQTVMAFMSDFALLGTALYPHPYGGMSPKIQGASLDHAIWFHRPFRADDYLLYEIDSPIASGARGFSRGSFWTRDGQLVASTAQESLLRLRKKPDKKK